MFRFAILAGQDFHRRDLVFMIGPAVGAVVGGVLRLVLAKMGVSKLVASLVVVLVFFAITFGWTAFVLTTLWPNR